MKNKEEKEETLMKNKEEKEEGGRGGRKKM